MDPLHEGTAASSDDMNGRDTIFVMRDATNVAVRSRLGSKESDVMSVPHEVWGRFVEHLKRSAPLLHTEWMSIGGIEQRRNGGNYELQYGGVVVAVTILGQCYFIRGIEADEFDLDRLPVA